METNNTSVTQTARDVDNTFSNSFDSNTEDLLLRLRTRAAIRRKMRFARDQVGKDRISDILDEAADAIERLRR